MFLGNQVSVILRTVMECEGQRPGDTLSALSHYTDTAADFRFSNPFFFYSSFKQVGLISPN